MKARITHYIALSTVLAAWLFAVGGCSTTAVSPQGALPLLPPPYVQVPHPGGYAISDLVAIFTTPSAPKLEDLKDCDSDFKKLRSMTQAQLELSEGARELVRRDPVRYHWCFYGKILELENSLKSESYLDEKQKSVLDVYGSLTPMARAFMQEFHDSRYLRWGIKHYRTVSEWVFYRKVEMTPQATSDLVEASNPFGLLRDPAGLVPVLEKYNLVRPEVVPPPPAATALSVPPTAPPVAVVPAAPPLPPVPPTTTVEVKTETTTVPPSTATTTEMPPLPPPSTEAAVPPLPPDVPVTSVPAPATEAVVEKAAPVERVPATVPDPVPPPAPEPVAPPASDPVAAPPAAQNDVGGGMTEAVLQGDSVAPAGN